MTRAPAFRGPGGRAAYLGASTAVFLVQQVVVSATLTLRGIHPDMGSPWFWLNPFRSLLAQSAIWTSDASLPILSGMIVTIAVDATLAWLAFGRARYLAAGGWAAALVIVPFLQLAAIAWLALAPEVPGGLEPAAERTRHRSARTATEGVLIGVGAIVAAVALSAIVVRIYGFALFLGSPILIATAVGYRANRDGPIGFKRTFGLVVLAFLLGGAALVAFAFEGVVCLILASPLALIMGLIGGAIGAGLAVVGPQARGTTLASVAVVPLLIVAEAALPPHTAFESLETIDVAAPPPAVWDALVHMEPIPDAPAAPFRWGLAYPLSGEILGTGVGATRRGVFSTGVAEERVTTWVPDAALSFVVLSDPPTMRELSPYAAVNAPHVTGYFRTIDVQFTLKPRPGGGTRLAFATRHALDLEPALYWTLLARWAVHENKLRVLAHVKHQAEAAAAAR